MQHALPFIHRPSRVKVIGREPVARSPLRQWHSSPVRQVLLGLLAQVPVRWTISLRMRRSLANVNKVSVDQFACKLDDVISLFGKNADVEYIPDKHRVTSVSASGVCTSNFDLPRFVADVKSAMHCVDVTMQDDDGKSLMLNCLFDSGSEVSVVKEDVIRALEYQVLGEVQLKSFDRHKAQGHLISLQAKLNNDRMPAPINLVACTHVSHDCLLSLADYHKLLAQDSETSLCDQARAYDVSVIQNVDAGGGSSVGLSVTSCLLYTSPSPRD